MAFKIDGEMFIPKVQEKVAKPNVNSASAPKVENSGATSKLGENSFYANTRKSLLNKTALTKPSEAVPQTLPTTALILPPSEALDQIKQLPIPDQNNEAAVREYNRKRAEIADKALENAVPPRPEDFKGLNPATAAHEYSEAKSYYDTQISKLKSLSSAAKLEPTKLPLDAPLPPHEALERINALPKPDVSNPKALAEHTRQARVIARASLEVATPPRPEDFKALKGRLAQLEYQEARTAYHSQISELTRYAQGISYERYDKTVDYMFNEMKTNINSQPVKQIQRDFDLIENPPLGSRPEAANGYLAHAAKTFYDQVKTNGPWDHKPRLREMLGLEEGVDLRFPVRGDTEHEVFYDIWSNIHYGYVGRAAGFSESDLQNAANISEKGTGTNDPVDKLTIQIGIDLWNKYGAKLTKDQFKREIEQRLPEINKAQETAEYVEKNENFKHVTSVSNGY